MDLIKLKLKKESYQIKKIITTLILIFTFFLLNGCRFSSALNIGDVSEIETNTFEGVSLKIEADTLTNTSAKVWVKNNTEFEITSGNEYDFFLQVYQDNHWYSIKTGDRSNTAEAMVLKGEQTIDINWIDIYGELPKGHYRIVKEFFPWSNEESLGYKNAFYLSDEFDIE